MGKSTTLHLDFSYSVISVIYSAPITKSTPRSSAGFWSGGPNTDAPLPPEAKKILKIWPRNGAFRSRLLKMLFFSMFSLFNFSSIFPGGQLTPFAPMCGRPWSTLTRDELKSTNVLKHNSWICKKKMLETRENGYYVFIPVNFYLFIFRFTSSSRSFSLFYLWFLCSLI